MALALFENIGLALASGVPAYMEAKKLAMDAQEAAQQRRAAKVMAALESQEFAAKNRLEEMEQMSKVFWDTYEVVPDADGMYTLPYTDIFGTGATRTAMTKAQRDYRLESLEELYRAMAESFRQDFPQYANAVYLGSPFDQLRQIGLAFDAEPDAGGVDTGIRPDTTAAPGSAMQSPSTGLNDDTDYIDTARSWIGTGLNWLRQAAEYASYALPVGPGDMKPIGDGHSDSWLERLVREINSSQSNWDNAWDTTWPPYQPEEEEEDLNQGLPTTFQPPR